MFSKLKLIAHRWRFFVCALLSWAEARVSSQSQPAVIALLWAIIHKTSRWTSVAPLANDARTGNMITRRVASLHTTSLILMSWCRLYTSVTWTISTSTNERCYIGLNLLRRSRGKVLRSASFFVLGAAWGQTEGTGVGGGAKYHSRCMSAKTANDILYKTTWILILFYYTVYFR